VGNIFLSAVVLQMTEDSYPISLDQSRGLNEWRRSISNDGLSLQGFFEVSSHVTAVLSNGTNLRGMPVCVNFSNKELGLERGIGTIELVDVEPNSFCANADLFLQQPYFDELWKEVRQGVFAESELTIEVAPVLRTKDGYVWNISETMSLFVLNATIHFIRRPSTGSPPS
jgi:hypothetical protein